jgi:hypothetical protein
MNAHAHQVINFVAFLVLESNYQGMFLSESTFMTSISRSSMKLSSN